MVSLGERCGWPSWNEAGGPSMFAIAAAAPAPPGSPLQRYSPATAAAAGARHGAEQIENPAAATTATAAKAVRSRAQAHHPASPARARGCPGWAGGLSRASDNILYARADGALTGGALTAIAALLAAQPSENALGCWLLPMALSGEFLCGGRCRPLYALCFSTLERCSGP